MGDSEVCLDRWVIKGKALLHRNVVVFDLYAKLRKVPGASLKLLSLPELGTSSRLIRSDFLYLKDDGTTTEESELSKCFDAYRPSGDSSDRQLSDSGDIPGAPFTAVRHVGNPHVHRSSSSSSVASMKRGRSHMIQCRSASQAHTDSASSVSSAFSSGIPISRKSGSLQSPTSPPDRQGGLKASPTSSPGAKDDDLHAHPPRKPSHKADTLIKPSMPPPDLLPLREPSRSMSTSDSSHSGKYKEERSPPSIPSNIRYTRLNKSLSSHILGTHEGSERYGTTTRMFSGVRSPEPQTMPVILEEEGCIFLANLSQRQPSQMLLAFTVEIKLQTKRGAITVDFGHLAKSVGTTSVEIDLRDVLSLDQEDESILRLYPPGYLRLDRQSGVVTGELPGDESTIKMQEILSGNDQSAADVSRYPTLVSPGREESDDTYIYDHELLEEKKDGSEHGLFGDISSIQEHEYSEQEQTYTSFCRVTTSLENELGDLSSIVEVKMEKSVPDQEIGLYEVASKTGIVAYKISEESLHGSVGSPSSGSIPDLQTVGKVGDPVLDSLIGALSTDSLPPIFDTSEQAATSIVNPDLSSIAESATTSSVLSVDHGVNEDGDRTVTLDPSSDDLDQITTISTHVEEVDSPGAGNTLLFPETSLAEESLDKSQKVLVPDTIKPGDLPVFNSRASSVEDRTLSSNSPISTIQTEADIIQRDLASDACECDTGDPSLGASCAAPLAATAVNDPESLAFQEQRIPEESRSLQMEPGIDLPRQQALDPPMDDSQTLTVTEAPFFIHKAEPPSLPITTPSSKQQDLYAQIETSPSSPIDIKQRGQRRLEPFFEIDHGEEVNDHFHTATRSCHTPPCHNFPSTDANEHALFDLSMTLSPSSPSHGRFLHRRAASTSNILNLARQRVTSDSSIDELATGNLSSDSKNTSQETSELQSPFTIFPTPEYNSMVKVDFTPRNSCQKYPILTCFFVLTFTERFFPDFSDRMMTVDIRGPKHSSIVMARVEDESVPWELIMTRDITPNIRSQIVHIPHPGFAIGQAFCVVTNCVLRDFDGQAQITLPTVYIADTKPSTEDVLLARVRHPLYTTLNPNDVADWIHLRSHKEETHRWKYERVNLPGRPFLPMQIQLSTLRSVMPNPIRGCPSTSPAYVNHCLVEIQSYRQICPGGNVLFNMILIAKVRRENKTLDTDPLIRLFFPDKIELRRVEIDRFPTTCYNGLEDELVIMDTDASQTLNHVEVRLEVSLEVTTGGVGFAHTLRLPRLLDCSVSRLTTEFCPHVVPVNFSVELNNEEVRDCENELIGSCVQIHNVPPRATLDISFTILTPEPLVKEEIGLNMTALPDIGPASEEGILELPEEIRDLARADDDKVVKDIDSNTPTMPVVSAPDHSRAAELQLISWRLRGMAILGLLAIVLFAFYSTEVRNDLSHLRSRSKTLNESYSDLQERFGRLVQTQKVAFEHIQNLHELPETYRKLLLGHSFETAHAVQEAADQVYEHSLENETEVQEEIARMNNELDDLTPPRERARFEIDPIEKEAFQAALFGWF